MQKYELIEKVMMKCPLCDKLHELELRKTIATTIIKEVYVDYEEIYYFCETGIAGENGFAPAGIYDKNLMNAKNVYRVKMGLLTSDEIVNIREQYGLSQSDFSKLLGWDEVTISRYETKAIQNESEDKILRLIRDNPMRAYELLDKNSNQFTDLEFPLIKEKILQHL